jgi:hypothetical protein
MSSLQNKMMNYEVAPPADAWGKIAAALDESSLDQEFPDRLYNMQVAPPAAAWDNIISSLHTAEVAEAPVVSMKRKTPSFVRYAAAAVLIGVVALGIVKWTSRTSVSNRTDIAQTDSLKETNASGENKNGIADKESNPASQQASTEESKTMLAQLTTQSKNTARKISRPVAAVNYNYDETYDDQYTNPIYAYESHAANLADRYIMLMTPDGNIIRMSKKLGNLVCCVSGEEQDADCKSQLKKWQEKMATSSLATSSDNFLDILTLVESLQDAGDEL